MAWSAVTDVNDGQSFGGAAWQTGIDAIVQLQGVLGTDEVDAAKLRASMRGVCYVTASQAVDDAALTSINPWDVTVLNPSAFPVSGTAVFPNVAGWYLVLARSELASASSLVTRRITRVVKNGSSVNAGADEPTVTGVSTPHSQHSWTFVQCNGTTDNIGVVVFQDNTASAALTINAELLVVLVLPT